LRLRRAALIRLSYVTLILDLAVPVQIVEPAFVQIVWRERSLRNHQFARGRLPRPAQRLHLEAAVLLDVQVARRDDVLPAGHAAMSARDDVIECQFLGDILLAAILAAETVPKEDVEPRERNTLWKRLVLTHC